MCWVRGKTWGHYPGGQLPMDGENMGYLELNLKRAHKPWKAEVL